MTRRTVCLSIFIAGLAAGQTSAPPAFDVVSVKRAPPGKPGGRYQFLPGGRFLATNVPLDFLIQSMYGLRNYQVVGAPSMMAIIADGDSARYDIQATAADPSATEAQMKEMVKTLLADRFQFIAHRETRDLPVYALMPAKSGIKVTLDAEHARPVGMGPVTQGWLEGRTSMQPFIQMLSRSVDRPIIDRTGYTGDFDYRLTWTPDGPVAQAGDGAAGTCPASWDALRQRLRRLLGPEPAPVNCPSLFTAIQEQMGLKLDPQKAPIEVLVIDHVEKPSEN